MSHLRRAARGGIALGALTLAAILLCAGLAPKPANTSKAPAVAIEPAPSYSNVTMTENVAYGPGDQQRLDVCQPTDAPGEGLSPAPKRAVVSVHGGSWRRGDKDEPRWRSVCEWLASEGFVAFSVNYSLAPAAPYPAGIRDLETVVDWLRQPAQVAAYGYDPALIGAFGGSSGANMVSQLAVQGTGALDSGSRVAAVVELSGPLDLTAAKAGGYSARFRQSQLDYLGCTSYRDCPAAHDASPVYSVDASDPPFFIAHSLREFIPIDQAEAMVSALRSNGVDATFIDPPGKRHSLALLDDLLRAEIVAFLRTHL